MRSRAPPMHKYDFKRCRDAAIGPAITLLVKGGGCRKNLPPRCPLQPTELGIGLPHAAQVAHQGEHVGISQRKNFLIRDRQ